MDIFSRTKNEVKQIDSKNSKTLTKGVRNMPTSEKQTF